MILVVSLEPSLCRVQFLRRGDAVAGVVAAHFEAIGPGTTLARVLRALDASVSITGLGGGPLADLWQESLAEEGISAELLETPTPLPMAVRHHTVEGTVEGERPVATRSYVEPAAKVGDAEMRLLLASVGEQLGRSRALAICGSDTSPGVDFAVWQLLREARSLGTKTVLHATGRVLSESAAAGPHHVVTSRALLRQAVEDDSSADELCARFLEHGTQSVLVTDGAACAELWLVGERVRLRPPKVSHRGGRFTGEAVAAGLLVGLARDWDVISAARYGMAAGTAQTQKRVGGNVNLAEVDGFFGQVRRVDPTA